MVFEKVIFDEDSVTPQKKLWGGKKSFFGWSKSKKKNLKKYRTKLSLFGSDWKIFNHSCQQDVVRIFLFFLKEIILLFAK
jgi:hypothetical protein